MSASFQDHSKPELAESPTVKEIGMKRKLMGLVVIVAGLAAACTCLFVAIQLVPTGVSTRNPPVVAEPAWDSAATRALAARACFDCHSNETRWPWYTRVAPMAWLVARDVAEGRETLNFSAWGTAGSGDEGDEGDEGEERGEALEELAEVIREGEMPPASYLLLHPEARLTPDEQQQLLEGLQQSLR
jgi:hypothetical protein